MSMASTIIALNEQILTSLVNLVHWSKSQHSVDAWEYAIVIGPVSFCASGGHWSDKKIMIDDGAPSWMAHITLNPTCFHFLEDQEGLDQRCRKTWESLKGGSECELCLWEIQFIASKIFFLVRRGMPLNTSNKTTTVYCLRILPSIKVVTYEQPYVQCVQYRKALKYRTTGSLNNARRANFRSKNSITVNIRSAF